MIRNNKVLFQDLGLISYEAGWKYQERLFDEITSIKRSIQEKNLNDQTTSNFLLFCEHPHVYTLGKSGTASNLLIDNIQLRAHNAEFFHIDRGGDITYHGPGQIVAYPILNLEYFVKGVKEYIFKLEESVILTLSELGMTSERMDGATGVWLDPGTPQARKICAIGVRTSRWVSMHGLAFNINTQLEYFNFINPCGYTDKYVTSVAREMGKNQDIAFVKRILKSNIAHVFDMEYISDPNV